MYLLDTTHCSRLLQGHPEVTRKLQQLGDVFVATCAIVCGELIFMAHKSQCRDENLRRVQEFFGDIQVYPVDEQTADIYGRLKCAILDRFGPREKAKRRKARTDKLGFSENDLWIAAIAKQHRLTVVSADGDFRRMREAADVSLETWLSAEFHHFLTDRIDQDEKEP